MDQAWVPDELNVVVPSSARSYDYLLGGGHNFEAGEPGLVYTS